MCFSLLFCSIPRNDGEVVTVLGLQNEGLRQAAVVARGTPDLLIEGIGLHGLLGWCEGKIRKSAIFLVSVRFQNFLSKNRIFFDFLALTGGSEIRTLAGDPPFTPVETYAN